MHVRNDKSMEVSSDEINVLDGMLAKNNEVQDEVMTVNVEGSTQTRVLETENLKAMGFSVRVTNSNWGKIPMTKLESVIVAILIVVAQVTSSLPLVGWYFWSILSANDVLYFFESKLSRNGELALRRVIRKYLAKKYIQFFFEIAENKEVVANTCRSIADIIKDYGYVNLESYMPQHVDATLTVLREESNCLQLENESNIDDEDDTKHEELFMNVVSDLLPTFAKSISCHFAHVSSKIMVM
ncbi:hypothetical protein V6N13_108026 [Hibiscus sabdariffa]